MLPPHDPIGHPLVFIGDVPSLEPDCACPTPPALAEVAFNPATRFTRPPDLFGEPLHGEWSLWCNTLAGGPPAVLNDDARRRLDQFGALCLPTAPVDRDLAAAGLIVPAGTIYQAPAGQPDTLTSWLHVSNACNLDCPYCYVRKSAARMDLTTGVRAIEALVATAARRGFRALKLKYAGGEAALHYRLVQQLHAYALETAAAHAIELRAVVLSNGTVMPPAFAAWLAGSEVRLMLSVDSTGADHDRQRPRKGGGQGAFATLERNLHQRLLPLGIRPSICITVTGRSAQTAHQAVEWAIRHELPFSLNFYRENDQSASRHELRYEEEQIIAGLRRAYAAIEASLPEWPFLDGLLDRVQARAHSHTCGVGRSYVVITHEGQVAQCQMELKLARPFTTDSDLLALVAAGPIPNPGVDEKEGCRACAWRYRCAGGCPALTLRATGRADIRSPDCNIYRTMMPAALRLEGLRILKSRSRYTPPTA